MEEVIKKADLMQYGFYDDSHNYTIVLNQAYLKELFNADVILLEEYEHK